MDWTAAEPGSILGEGTQFSFHNVSGTAVGEAHSSVRLIVGTLSSDKAAGA